MTQAKCDGRSLPCPREGSVGGREDTKGQGQECAPSVSLRTPCPALPGCVPGQQTGLATGAVVSKKCSRSKQSPSHRATPETPPLREHAILERGGRAGATPWPLGKEHPHSTCLGSHTPSAFSSRVPCGWEADRLLLLGPRGSRAPTEGGLNQGQAGYF